MVTFNKILAVEASAFQPWLLPSPLLRALQVAAPQVVFPVGVKPRFPRGKGSKCEQKKTIVTNTKDYFINGFKFYRKDYCLSKGS